MSFYLQFFACAMFSQIFSYDTQRPFSFPDPTRSQNLANSPCSELLPPIRPIWAECRPMCSYAPLCALHGTDQSPLSFSAHSSLFSLGSRLLGVLEVDWIIFLNQQKRNSSIPGIRLPCWLKAEPPGRKLASMMAAGSSVS